FGDVPYLARLSERLFRATQGNPARLVELSRHLVREGVITNVHGTWVLPQELPEELFKRAGEAHVQMALAYLSEPAKQLGASLSVRRGLLPLEMCKALSDFSSAQLFSGLEELTREGILSSSGLGYHFEDEAHRRGLRLLLTSDQAQRYHRKLATFLLAVPDA